MQLQLLKDEIASGKKDTQITEVYENKEVAAKRIIASLEKYEAAFGLDDVVVISTPGRTEILGNHTDHNHGRVLAGSVSLDMLAVAAKQQNNAVVIHSEGFKPLEISLNNLAPVKEEEETSASLVRGIAAAMKERGYEIGGFKAFITSDVLKGSGLSSSTAYEVLIGSILNYLYNDGRMSPVENAKLSQYAENVYFGKPSGLMDQTACASGGIIAIDFRDNANPIIKDMQLSLEDEQHALCIVDIKADHANLTDAYASIPIEMKKVAALFGKSVLREVTKAEILQNAKRIREKCGDRAFLRAVHFFDDDERAGAAADAVEKGDFKEFLRIVNASGRSSYMYLQNVCVEGAIDAQPMGVALYISDTILGDKGAYRVHGGGFAGTIQAFVPLTMLEEYRSTMESVFGEGSCYVLSIRKHGTMRLL